MRPPIALALLAVALALPAVAPAQTPVRKFGRGLAGMTTGFLELPGNVVRETDRRGAGEGIPIGFAKGLGMIVVRELIGVYEFLTAPFPAPAGYRPILEPEYPWGYFDGGGGGHASRNGVRPASTRRPRRPTVPY